jgi:hypothetical protein
MSVRAGMVPRAGTVSPTFISRSGWGKGSGRRSIASTALKIAVLAPIPIARVSTATAVNVGERRKVRARRVLALHAVEGGVEGSLLDGEDVIRHPLDVLRDGVAVEGLDGEGLQDEHVEGAIEQLAFRWTGSRHWFDPAGSDPPSGRSPTREV